MKPSTFHQTELSNEYYSTFLQNRRLFSLISNVFGLSVASEGKLPKRRGRQRNLNLISVANEVLLKKRLIIEAVIESLKTQTQLEHTCYRGLINLPSEYCFCVDGVSVFGEQRSTRTFLTTKLFFNSRLSNFFGTCELQAKII